MAMAVPVIPVLSLNLQRQAGLRLKQRLPKRFTWTRSSHCWPSIMVILKEKTARKRFERSIFVWWARQCFEHEFLKSQEGKFHLSLFCFASFRFGFFWFCLLKLILVIFHQTIGFDFLSENFSKEFVSARIRFAGHLRAWLSSRNSIAQLFSGMQTGATLAEM